MSRRAQATTTAVLLLALAIGVITGVASCAVYEECRAFGHSSGYCWWQASRR